VYVIQYTVISLAGFIQLVSCIYLFNNSYMFAHKDMHKNNKNNNMLEL